MRWISRHIAADELLDHRVVARFDLTTDRRYWLVLQSAEASVCLHDPGFETDIVVAADVAALHGVYTVTAPLAGGR